MGQWKFHHLPFLASLWLFLSQSVSHIYFIMVYFSDGAFGEENGKKKSSKGTLK
jgi:hypothetical protein